MMENKGTGGVGFFGLLTIVFIVLKLTGVISWSWFWVLPPTLAAFVLFCVLVAVYIFIERR